MGLVWDKDKKKVDVKVEDKDKAEENGGMRAQKRKKDSAKVAQLFEESEDKVKAGLYLPRPLFDKIQAAAKENNKSLNAVMVKILEKFFEE